MADVPTLPPELARSVSSLARTLVAAARSWALYPPDHPAVRGSLDRLRGAIADATGGQAFGFGVTPESFMVAGVPAAGRDAGALADAARWLHDRDILDLTFVGDASLSTLQRLLGVLCEDSRIIRQRGGPAAVWAEEGDASIALTQIDFSRVLADRDAASPIRRKDDLWRAIVRGVLDRRQPTDHAAQARLLAISGDVTAIAELTGDVIAPHHASDGSPMLTSQAAAVVAAYRHLVGIVDVLSPERRQEVMQNIAAATANLNPQIVVQMLAPAADPASAGEPGADVIIAGIAAAMDDEKVAQLLATTLAIEGQASQRLATVFDTIAPDDERKRRVLSLTRRMLSETDFGRKDQFQTLWSSMEELLLTYNEKPFVSDTYRRELDTIGDRAAHMAAAELPPELAGLIDTLGQDNVRRLSVTLLIDLLTLERDASRAPELARDVAALAEDLLLAGDYESALTVAAALQAQAASPSATSQASRVALDALVNTIAFHEAADLLGDMSEREAAQFSDMCGAVGPAATDTLRRHLEAEEATTARARATSVIRRYGVRAVSRLGPLVASTNCAAQRNAAELLGEIAAPEAVPMLQPLLRGRDARVTSAAVRALANIKDPAAARAIHTVLRAATGEQRRAVVDALVAERDPRVVPVLVRIIEESEPFGTDHPIVLDSVAALAQVGDDHAVPALAALLRKKKLLGRKKVKAVRQQTLQTLRAIDTAATKRAIDEAARTGDRHLRRLARSAGVVTHA